MIIEKHISITDPELSVVQTLKQQLQLSSIQIKQAIDSGCLWLEKGSKSKRLRRLKTQLKIGQTLHFYYNSEVLKQPPLKAKLVKDLQAYSIWNKPAGMLCQGSKWSDHTTISRTTEKYFKGERKAIIVHRLDKMTSGLIIIAHHGKIAAAFGDIFLQRRIDKYYQARVYGNYKPQSNEQLIDSPIDDKPAISRITFLEYDAANNQSLLQIKIETGRKHQIRRHLCSIGFAIVGDRLYGDNLSSDDATSNSSDLQLCAVQLEFTCPVNGERQSYQLDQTEQFYNNRLLTNSKENYHGQSTTN